MNQTVRFGLVLLIFSAVAGGILALSNSATAPIIAEREKEKSLGAYVEMFPEADDLVAIDEAKLAEIMADNIFVQEVFEAKKGGETIGYAFKTKSGGYGGDIITVSGFNIDGTVAGIKVVENSETPSLGTRIVDDPTYAESYIGKSLANKLVLAAIPSADNEVQLLSGATISSAGVLYGVNGAREAYLNFFTDTPVVEEKEDDRGFGPNGLVFKDADEFVAIDAAKLAEIQVDNIFVQEVFEAKKGGETIGYAFKTKSGGYGGDIITVSGFALDGTITGIRVIENSETLGLGTKIVEDPAYQESYVGKSAANELVTATSPAADNEVLLISGATISAEGVLYGVNGAREAYLNFFTDTPVVEEKEDDRGFGPNGLVFKEADEFVAIDAAKLAEIQADNIFVQEVFEAKKGGETIGYAFKTRSGGYGGDLITISGFALDGTIVGIRVVENVETLGLGTKIVDNPAYQESYVGKSAANELVLVASPAADNEVLLLSGATVSSEGVLYGVNGAREAFVNFFSN